MTLVCSIVRMCLYKWFRAVGQDTFQPKIGFKTRYGLIANPFAETGAISGAATAVNDAGSANSNRYYQRVQVANLM